MTSPVRKAVIPAAGLGTRFLPATKSQPKEMLPVVDKPSIQYVVEEAVRAGLTDILIITGRGKRAIEDHFDRNFELEYYLEQKGKPELLKEVQETSELGDIHYIRQQDPLGLGHAVSVAREHVGNEPFAVLLGDDIMVDESQLLRSMLDVHDRYGRSVLALKEVTRGRDLVVRLRRARRGRGGARAGEVDRREAGEGRRAVEPRGHRPLRVHARDLRRARPHRAGRGRRAAAHRRDRPAQRDPDGLRPRVHRRPLRHRPEGRLPPGQRRARARPRRPRPRARAVPRRARSAAAASSDRHAPPAAGGVGSVRSAGDPARRRPGRDPAARCRALAPAPVAARATRSGSCSRSRSSPASRSRRSRTPRWTATRVRAADTAGATEATPVRLQVVADLPAGHAPTVPVGPGRGDPDHDRRADPRRAPTRS